MLAFIGGSAFTALDGWSVLTSVSPETPYGAISAAISVGRYGDLPALFLPRHGVSNPVAPHCVNYRANLWALKHLGATTVVAINAVGGISSFAPPGAILIPDQIIDYTWGREHTYHDGVSLPLRH